MGTDAVPCGTKDKSPDQLMLTARWNFQLEVIVSTNAGCPPVHHLWPILVKQKSGTESYNFYFLSLRVEMSEKC